MIEEPIPPEKFNAITAFISSLELLNKVNESALEDLVDSMTLVSLEGGETFIHQADLETSLYILMQGRLRVFIESEKEKKLVFIGEVTAGNIVGEIAFLTEQPRSSTVRAIRDSQLIKLDAKTFQHFKLLELES